MAAVESKIRLELDKIKGQELSIEERRKEKFKKFLRKINDDVVASYDNFIVVMDKKQYYIGRVFIMAKREDASDFLSLSADETLELKSICADISTVYGNIDELRPDKINYAMLGNDMEHFHMHVIPRYKDPRIISVTDEDGRNFTVTFNDYNYGSNYSCPEARDFQTRVESDEGELGVAVSTIKNSIRRYIRTQLSEIRAPKIDQQDISAEPLEEHLPLLPRYMPTPILYSLIDMPVSIFDCTWGHRFMREKTSSYAHALQSYPLVTYRPSTEELSMLGGGSGLQAYFSIFRTDVALGDDEEIEGTRLERFLRY